MTDLTTEEIKQVDKWVQQWLDVDANEHSRKIVTKLRDQGNYRELRGKMSPRIAFGTAGLRSAMAPGFAHMNDVTVLQASQGLVAYILKGGDGGDGNVANDSSVKRSSIVVGYDHRYHSQRFAELTASVALASGMDVYYLGSVDKLSGESMGEDGSLSETSADRMYVHTPMVPFAIDHYGASAGVMVTASHNPARDNGYKVYYGNGCQIIPPQDAGIASSIDANLTPWSDKNVWDVRENFTRGLASGNLRPVKHELTALYVADVADQLVHTPKPLSFGFVYTPMHGVGGEIFSKICARLDVTYTIVPEQASPDPDFPTVRFPNPEEAGALDLAISHAKRTGLKLVIANDPDADRFSVAIETRAGAWRQLTGNEIGILFAAYVVEELANPTDLSRTVLVNSTVSSQLLRSMAEKIGCQFMDTLTGFKWIGNKAIDLKKDGYLVPFGYEEAIGYMFGLVNDKDGITASVVWMQLYDQWFANGDIDPIDKLEQIYTKYGWYKECNGYYKLDDLSKTTQIFQDTIRASYDPTKEYPRIIGDFKVLEWRDLTVGFESSTPDHKPVLPTDANSQMITAVLQPQDATGKFANDKVRFTCRGSGTEPKLKVYIEGSSQVSEQSADTLARRCWQTLKEEWFKPEENALEEVV
ncbi:hypothetical protein JCM33374_g3808 [Metschnikowia sp. JCM 33374]|nr:hypothetical protein JCM33374_g3808 [Metschnikowia sp. JCM 33374]